MSPNQRDPGSEQAIEKAEKWLVGTVQKAEAVTVLTGAGVSAESGIPTFRGPDGFWTVGSKAYYPQEMATRSMFARHPKAVWTWYLYRMGLCQTAKPNAGHLALATMESLLGDLFTLITQNVDNLHIRAGNSPARTFQIHGNLFQTRCAAACTQDLFPLPEGLSPKGIDESVTSEECRLLTCPFCGGWTRPHVLWFDETYNERHFRFNSALDTANKTRLLITVGTAGATTLPNHIVNLVHGNQGLMIDINVADNPFASLAMQSDRGLFIQRASSEALVRLVDAVSSTMTL